jgi:hypothetical protein
VGLIVFSGASMMSRTSKSGELRQLRKNAKEGFEHFTCPELLCLLFQSKFSKFVLGNDPNGKVPARSVNHIQMGPPFKGSLSG